MTIAPRAAAAVSCVAIAVLMPPIVKGAQDRLARVYVAVVGADGRPVTGLTASDFQVRENGSEREIVSAAPASQPMALAMLTDGLGGMAVFSVLQVRAALQSFVRVVRSGTTPDTQIGLMRVDSAPVEQAKLSSTPDALDKALARLVSFPGPSVLFEGIGDTCPALARHASDRRVIFALVAGYRGDTSQVRRNEVPECLRSSGTSLWTIEATFDGAPIRDTRRDFLMMSVTPWSGGMHVAVSTGTALDDAAVRMADILVSQYAVVYGPSDRREDGHLEVYARSPGVRVISPAWTRR